MNCFHSSLNLVTFYKHLFQEVHACLIVHGYNGPNQPIQTVAYRILEY